MTEAEAVRKSLQMCGFINLINSWVHEDPELVVYIPMNQTNNFKQVIDYFNYYVFSKEPNVKERFKYYQMARRVENHYEGWKERICAED